MEQSRIQSYAAVAEVVSAAAIIVSLLYVGYEYRRTSTMSSREADVILFERTRESNRILIESPGMADIVHLAETAPEALSPADSLRFLAYRHDFFDTWEIAWYYHADGILETETWEEWDQWFSEEARLAPDFAWRETRRHFTGEGFRDHVDRALAGG
jgi:hypothetical protein